MIREDMLRFGWDIAKLENKGLIAIVDASSARIGFPSEEKYKMPETGLDVDRLLLKTMHVADQIGAKRVVIFGADELGEGKVKEKDMITGKESLKALTDYIQ